MSLRKLPKHVYKDRSRYYYRPYLGRENGVTKYGKPIRLGPLDMSMSDLWKAYEQVTGQTTDTLKWLVNKYLKSAQFLELAPRTQSDYGDYADKLLNRRLANGKPWGDAPLSTVTPKVIRRYLDNHSAKISANRHIQFLKSVFNWGIERFDSVTANPCLGVKLNKQTARTRYIEDWEYELVLTVARSMRTPYFAPAMELAYLCRARRDEVFSLTTADEGEDGLFLKRTKGSNSEITAWTPRLKMAVSEAKKLNADAPTPIKGALLIHDRKGLKHTKNALDSAWQRIIKKAINTGIVIDGEAQKLKESFTFHDIKAKGYSDQKNPSAGHRSDRMHAVYMRKARLVQPAK